jgi:drug/metabolite transporter (DMT)-like permease
VGRRELLFLVLFGVTGVAFVQWLYFVAIERLPVGIALLIQFIGPLFVALFARFVYHERIRRRIWVALVLCISGLAVVVELWSGLAFDTVGITAALAAAVALAAYILMAEHERKRRDPVSLSFYGFLFAALFWAVVQPLWQFPWETLGDTVSLQGNLDEHSAPVWVLIGFVVVVGTMITFSLLTGSLKHITATRASIVATLEPVIATAVAWLWLDESFGAAQIVGGVVVLAGIFLAQTAR